MGSKATRGREDVRAGAANGLVPGRHLHPSTPGGRGAVGTNRRQAGGPLLGEWIAK